MNACRRVDGREPNRIPLSACREAGWALAGSIEGAYDEVPALQIPDISQLAQSRRAVGQQKRTYRLYTEEDLQVHTKKRKMLQRPRLPVLVPTRVNERWSMDFFSGQLSQGRRFRILNITDDYPREIVGQSVSGQFQDNW